MGGGSKQKQTSTVTTTTTTNIRDIGLTGANAVDIVDVLEKGSVESEAIRAQSLDNIVQQVGSSYNQLIGGANDLIKTGTQQVADQANLVQNSASEAQNTIRTLAEKATGENSDMVKLLPYVAVVGISLASIIYGDK